jgi:hypothetical protein
MWRTQTGLDKTSCITRTLAVHDHDGMMSAHHHGMWPLH